MGNGVYKDKNGKFYFKFSEMAGKKRLQYTSKRFDKEKECIKARAEYILQNSSKANTFDIRKTTLNDLGNLFFKHAEMPNVYQKGTLRNYKGSWNNHLKELREYTIAQLTPIRVQRWYDTSLIAPYKLQATLKLLGAIFTYCSKRKLIKKDDNPFEFLEPVKITKIKHNRLSSRELAYFFSMCKDVLPQFYLLFVLATLTGMRLGEYTALNLEDIDFDNSQIKVYKQYTNREEKNRLKNNADYRIVDVPEFVLEVVKWHKRKFSIFSGRLFPSPVGKKQPIADSTVRNYWKKLLEYCGYDRKYMRLHDLRGQYVDILNNLQTPLAKISSQVGHKRVSTTANVYSEILRETAKTTMNQLDSYIEENVL